MKIVAFVPAKSESERISNKNTAILDGEFLFKRKLQQLLRVDLIDEVYLDTDSQDLIDKAANLEIKSILRPKELASNKTDGHELFAFECSQVTDADIYIQALCTAPFIDENTIKRAIEQLLANEKADSLIAVSTKKIYSWKNNNPEYGYGRVPNSVDLPPTIAEAMSLYIVKKPKGAPAPKMRFGKNCILFDITPIEDIDINYPADLAMAEEICLGQRSKRNLRNKLLKAHLSSPILSDILKEMGVKGVTAPNFKCISGRKILGTAKTLSLVALEDGQKYDRNKKTDDWKGIYRAYDSYNFVRSGDIIVVATNIPNKAYFGDLNANLAIRAGAEGAIIDGYTRDSYDVNELGFSVFAHDSHCDDIKYEGTLKAMNMPIKLGGIDVANGDYVFADRDGVVIIPEAIWPEVEAQAWHMLRNEAQIRFDILEGKLSSDILSNRGEF